MGGSSEFLQDWPGSTMCHEPGITIILTSPESRIIVFPGSRIIVIFVIPGSLHKSTMCHEPGITKRGRRHHLRMAPE